MTPEETARRIAERIVEIVASPGLPHSVRIAAEILPLVRRARALEQAIRALGIEQFGGCWCDEAARIRDHNGKHSPACAQVVAALKGDE